VPVRARWEEHLRVVTVAHGQTSKIIAGDRTPQMAGKQRHRLPKLIVQAGEIGRSAGQRKLREC
jgi:hypothetical protein